MKNAWYSQLHYLKVNYSISNDNLHKMTRNIAVDNPPYSSKRLIKPYNGPPYHLLKGIEINKYPSDVLITHSFVKYKNDVLFSRCGISYINDFLSTTKLKSYIEQTLNNNNKYKLSTSNNEINKQYIIDNDERKINYISTILDKIKALSQKDSHSMGLKKNVGTDITNDNFYNIIDTGLYTDTIDSGYFIRFNTSNDKILAFFTIGQTRMLRIFDMDIDKSQYSYTPGLPLYPPFNVRLVHNSLIIIKLHKNLSNNVNDKLWKYTLDPIRYKNIPKERTHILQIKTNNGNKYQ